MIPLELTDVIHLEPYAWAQKATEIVFFVSLILYGSFNRSSSSLFFSFLNGAFVSWSLDAAVTNLPLQRLNYRSNEGKLFLA